MCSLPLQVSDVSIFHKEQIPIYQSGKLSSEKDDFHSHTMLLHTFSPCSKPRAKFFLGKYFSI